MQLRKKIAFYAAIVWMSVSSLFLQTACAAEKPTYLKSVTYFGDEWPINYWGSEDVDMASNFAKIKADGFNSIILVVPWREFQPAEPTQEFNPAAFERLNEVMSCAEEYGLWVVLRIGYTWDYYGKSEMPERYENLVLENGSARSLWMRYCEAIYQAASSHSNFHSGFITWEDFWDYVNNMSRSYTQVQMLRKARSSGYQKYLSEHYSLEYVSEKYGKDFADFSEVYLPYRHMEAAELFFAFYDDMLNKLLAQSQNAFPGLSMEVRADGDPIYRKDGSISYYYSHAATYPCDGAEYSALMYSVSMGQQNQSDRISANEALAAMNRNMNKLLSGSGKKYYAEQLLYMDSTVEYSYNTQIYETETDAFVRALAPTLQQTTMGYGLWVYRNYVNNSVYNGQFGLGTTGWKFSGNSRIEDRNGNAKAYLAEHGSIFQELSGRMATRETIYVELDVETTQGFAELTVKLGEREQTINVKEAGTYKLEFPWNSNYNITIRSDRGVYVDDVRVYTYEQYGRIYGTDGTEQDLADDFRMLNALLP